MKRVFISSVAALAATILPASGAFATPGNALDYANSIGQIQESDTVNRVVEATTDGGYVVGGQTIVCSKYLKLTPYAENDDDDNDGTDGEHEYISIEECVNAVRRAPIMKGGELLVPGVIPPICDLDDFRTERIMALGNEDYYYHIDCENYIAKFKKDGTREWLTIFENGDDLLAVGETPNDYLLLTSKGVLLDTNKSGVKGQSTQTGISKDNDVIAAKIDRDGSIYASFTFGNLCKYNIEGETIACIPVEGDNREYSTDSDGFIVMNGEIFMYYSSEEESGVARISKDLSTITPILVESKVAPLFNYYVFSGDAEGNVLLLKSYFVDGDDDPTELPYNELLSVNSDGDVIAQIVLNEEAGNVFGMGTAILPGYVFYNFMTNTLVKYNKNLEADFVHTLSAGETINGSSILDDGSVVLVGSSTASSENYDVEGGMNGIQMRLGAMGGADDDDDDELTPTGDGVENPKTFDGLELFAVMGVAIIVTAGFAARKVFVRR